MPFVDDENPENHQAGEKEGAVVIEGREPVEGQDDAADAESGTDEIDERRAVGIPFFFDRAD